MSWFGPKLEPGERVVWRLPAPLTARQWTTGLAIAAAVVAMILAVALWFGSPNTAFFAMMIVILFGFRILPDCCGWGRTIYVITDRRLLAKRSAYWWSPTEIRLDEIEIIWLNAATYFIVVRGGGHEIEIAPERIELAELERVIERAKAGAL